MLACGAVPKAQRNGRKGIACVVIHSFLSISHYFLAFPVFCMDFALDPGLAGPPPSSFWWCKNHQTTVGTHDRHMGMQRSLIYHHKACDPSLEQPRIPLRPSACLQNPVPSARRAADTHPPDPPPPWQDGRFNRFKRIKRIERTGRMGQIRRI